MTKSAPTFFSSIILTASSTQVSGVIEKISRLFCPRTALIFPLTFINPEIAEHQNTTARLRCAKSFSSVDRLAARELSLDQTIQMFGDCWLVEALNDFV